MSPDDKARARSERDRRMAAMKRGEEWALGPRDRGPIKKLARDYVDSHRRPSEYYMYVLVVLLVALLEAGVDQVTLLDDDRKEYGPMSLHPET